jgi:hypothetical protein
LIIEGDSQVNCLDFSPDIYLQDTFNNPNSSFWMGFDLNNDSVTDLKFKVDAAHPQMGSTTGTADVLLSDSNLQLVCDTTYYPWPDTLKSGDTLQNEMTGYVWTSLLQYPQYPFNLRYVINGNGGLGGTGLWQSSIVHYLGFRLINNTDTLYGYFELKVSVGAGSGKIWINKVCFEGDVNTISGVGNIAEPASQIIFYPNPFHSLIRIEAPLQKNYTGSIIDILGRSLQSFSFSGIKELDVSKLPAGIYLFILSDTKYPERSIYKMVKE